MKQTYKTLDTYDHLITPGSNTETIPVPGDTDETLRQIERTVKSYYKRVKHLADFLCGDSIEQTAYNIWHFCRPMRYGGQINYKLDDRGTEQLRTPSRSWADRKAGIDCDDYTILICSILINLGISPQMVVIAQSGKPEFSHIYTAVGATVYGNRPSGGIIIDPVMPELFNQHPDNITKVKIMTLNISQLDGLNDTYRPDDIIGVGLIARPDAVTKMLMDQQSKLIESMQKKKGVLGSSGKEIDELTKIRSLIMFNATKERDDLLPMMPLVKRVNNDGTFTWINEKAQKVGEKYLSEISQLSGLGDINEDEFEINELDGFGRRRDARKPKEQRKKDRDAKRDKLKEDIKDAIRHPGQAVKQSLIDANTKFNPLVAAARGSLLVVIRVNFRNLAARMAFGYMSEAEAVKAGYDVDTWKKAQEAVKKTEKAYEKVGGNLTSLRKAVELGKNKKAFFGSPKGIEGLGLGEPASVGISAAITAAAGLIAAIGKFFSSVKFKKKDGSPGEGETDETANNTETFDLDEFTNENQDLLDKITPGGDGYNTAEEKKFMENTVIPPGDDSTAKKWVPFAIGGGLLLLFGVGFALTRGKKGKKKQ